MTVAVPVGGSLYIYEQGLHLWFARAAFARQREEEVQARTEKARKLLLMHTIAAELLRFENRDVVAVLRTMEELLPLNSIANNAAELEGPLLFDLVMSHLTCSILATWHDSDANLRLVEASTALSHYVHVVSLCNSETTQIETEELARSWTYLALFRPLIYIQKCCREGFYDFDGYAG